MSFLSIREEPRKRLGDTQSFIFDEFAQIAIGMDQHLAGGEPAWEFIKAEYSLLQRTPVTLFITALSNDNHFPYAANEPRRNHGRHLIVRIPSCFVLCAVS